MQVVNNQLLCQAPKYLMLEYLHCGTTSVYKIIANECQSSITIEYGLIHRPMLNLKLW